MPVIRKYRAYKAYAVEPKAKKGRQALVAYLYEDVLAGIDVPKCITPKINFWIGEDCSTSLQVVTRWCHPGHVAAFLYGQTLGAG